MKERMPIPENLDEAINRLLDKLAEYAEFYDEAGPELQERWYWVEMEARVCKDRAKAKVRLEKFIEVIESEKQKKN